MFHVFIFNKVSLIYLAVHIPAERNIHNNTVIMNFK